MASSSDVGASENRLRPFGWERGRRTTPLSRLVAATRDVTSIPSAGCFRNSAMPGVPPAPTGCLSGVAYFLESEFLQRIKALECFFGVRVFPGQTDTRLVGKEGYRTG